MTAKILLLKCDVSTGTVEAGFQRLSLLEKKGSEGDKDLKSPMEADYLVTERDPQTLSIFLGFTEIRHGVNFIMGSSLASVMSDKHTPLMIRKLQTISVGGQRMSGAQAWEFLQRPEFRRRLHCRPFAID